MSDQPAEVVRHHAVSERAVGWSRCLMLLLVVLFVGSPLLAQENRGLNSRQEALSSRYGRFEKLLLQMAEYLGRTDPDRAELLMRALSRSREERISTRMNSIVQLLNDEDFDEALEGQEQLVGNLRQLLELLQSEDRRSELEEEAARVRKMLKDVNKLIGDQKIARATAARSGKPSDGLKSQQRVADKTKKVVEAAKAADDRKAAESENSEPEAGDPEEGDGKEGKSNSESAEPKASPGSKEGGEAQDSDSKSKGGKPEGSESKGQSSKSQSDAKGGGESSDPEQEEKSAGREQLEEAQKAMERALEELKQDQKEESSAEQDKALSQLLAAKEELEEKLRQLREEERELRLVKLEVRFQKMLAMQLAINSGTTTLAGTPTEKWLGADFTRSRELGQLETAVGLEAAKALAVLREEGTSVSFPLAVEDVREDVGIVAGRLEDAKVGELTQEIQADIVEALQEMVGALQKEMEKGEDKQQGQQQQQQTPQDQQGDPVLVEMLAELRMLRTLQKRINRRTKQIGRELKTDQAQDSDLLQQLDRLAERQIRIRQTAIDLARTRKEK
ncbi:MAG: hypothetical protein AB8G99_26130 [Planctomycetaceae bacterium]